MTTAYAILSALALSGWFMVFLKKAEGETK